MKIDDVDWHLTDASNEVQAGMHIALLYHWILRRELIKDDYAPSDFKLSLENQTVLPGELFIEWADGKIFVSQISYKAASFLKSYYQERYLPDLQRKCIPKLRYDIRYKAPYDIRDIWDNVEVASVYFDNAYRKWEKSKRGFLRGSDR